MRGNGCIALGGLRSIKVSRSSMHIGSLPRNSRSDWQMSDRSRRSNRWKWRKEHRSEEPILRKEDIGAVFDLPDGVDADGCKRWRRRHHHVVDHDYKHLAERHWSGAKRDSVDQYHGQEPRAAGGVACNAD